MNIKTNPKAFWKYSKSRLKTRSTINGLIDSDGNINTVHSDTSKVQIFNNYFTSVFTNEDVSRWFLQRQSHLCITHSTLV